MIERTKRFFHFATDRVGDSVSAAKIVALSPITISHGALELFRAVRETRQITSHERRALSVALLDLRMLLSSGHPGIAVRVINQYQTEYKIPLTENAHLKCYYTKLGEDQFRVQFDFISINEHGKPQYEFWGPFHINQRMESIHILKFVLRHENAREVEQVALQDLEALLLFLREHVFQLT